MTPTADLIRLKIGMIRVMAARKERGPCADRLTRYSTACDDLSRLVGVDMDFREMGSVGSAWLLDDPIRKERVLLKFWRDMVVWLLRKAVKICQQTDSKVKSS